MFKFKCLNDVNKSILIFGEKIAQLAMNLCDQEASSARRLQHAVANLRRPC